MPSNAANDDFDPLPSEDHSPVVDANIQHISDREDLSQQHKETFFIRYYENYGGKRKGSRRISSHQNGTIHKRYSSCSSIYLDDSTVSQPNLRCTLKCVSLAACYLMKGAHDPPRLKDIFNEELHPLMRPIRKETIINLPEHRHVYKFFKTLFSSAQLTAECAIISLIYVERLMEYAEIDIHPSNWRRIILGAILLASKVWDDQAVWNIDYCQILKDTTVEDMNALEREILQLIMFNINVPSSIYAKYYFDLRTIADENNYIFPAEPLSIERAKKLEAMNRLSNESWTDHMSRPTVKRYISLNPLPTKSVAVLS